MTIRAIVLGCGLVGETMVRDLAADSLFEVTAVDLRREPLERLASLPRVAVQTCDLSDADALRRLVGDFDIVLGALPSRFGFAALRAVIEAGKPYCDISFMPEDALRLDALARQCGVTAVVDCGVSPGLSNLCVGHACTVLDDVDEAIIYVGGLPKHPQPPFFYKAPFAPADVIEEYTRPARVMEDGRVVEKPALSEPETIAWESVGELEAFLTDGLRTLLKTVRIPNMREKTLRFPGHAHLMRALREAGLFGTTLVRVGEVEVIPRELTSRLLFPHWTFEEGEEEFTVMRVLVRGKRNARACRMVYDLYDEFDRASGTRSMARTTAYPCTITARMIARGQFRHPGIVPLEIAARQPGFFDRMVEALQDRGVMLTRRVAELDEETRDDEKAS
ncbi:MAG: saccharopine dehydrogenase [Planctomycetota bacterium]|nr:MAG: saccharopine dehydrogenase [Planctomycetota bacterium]